MQRVFQALYKLKTWLGIQIEKPLLSYVTLCLLQLKVLWGVWIYKDLTYGDTTSYFVKSLHWNEDFHVNIAWSPLYTIYYGTLIHLSDDAYFVTILHRLLIVFAATMLVLAFMRCFLPKEIAWLMAAWWAVLPINFDTLYEVHLFSILPILVAWLIIFRQPTSKKCGWGLGILAASGVLVRNEYLFSAAIFGVICMIWEWKNLKSLQSGSLNDTPNNWRGVLKAYGVPLLAAGFLCGLTVSRNYLSLADTRHALTRKHTANMGQVYAYGYQQRHPEWTKDPWIEYQSLMESDFGESEPTLIRMIQNNPAAVWEHFKWNYRLLPSGLQVLLFNATSGKINPDYAPVRLHFRRALWYSIGWVALFLAGLCFILKDFKSFWRGFFQRHARGWLCALSVVFLYFILVIPTQRPRPSYLFSVSAFLMAVTGVCLWAVARKWPAWIKACRRFFPIAMLLCPILAPCYFLQHSHKFDLGLHRVYKRLKPYQPVIADPKTVFLKGEFAEEIKNYLGKGKGRGLSYGSLAEWDPQMPFHAFLNMKGITLFYFDHVVLPRLEPAAAGDPVRYLNTMDPEWKVIASGNAPEWWVLGVKSSAYEP